MEHFLGRFSPKDKKRMAYIEGREDIFETKILSIVSGQEKDTEAGQKKILVVSRDPGSANALVPVLEILQKDSDIKIDAITDGRAQEILQKKFTTTDITPKDTPLKAGEVIGKPDLLLVDSSEPEPGLETYAAGTFEAPIVLLEDYYGTSREYLKRLTQRGVRLPEKICVMDEGAKRIILADFPELADRVEVTGQPAFDRFAFENTKAINEQTRKKLNLKDTDRVITYMSSLEGVDFIKELAASLAGAKEDFTFILRRHPRDNTTYEEYEKIFNDAGISLINTNAIDTDSVGALSDVIMTSTSTESLNAIYRRKLTLNIVDKKLDIYENRSMPPTVELGASAGISDIGELSKMLPKLLDKESELNHQLKENMQKYYLQDGKNAERVARVVRGVIESH